MVGAAEWPVMVVASPAVVAGRWAAVSVAGVPVRSAGVVSAPQAVPVLVRVDLVLVARGRAWAARRARKLG